MSISEYYGRRVLMPAGMHPADPRVVTLPTMQVVGHQVRCLRCNTLSNKGEASLPRGQYYCRHCLQLGRVSTLTQFYHVPEPNQFECVSQPLTWHGQLSPLQERVATQVCRRMTNHKRQLLWAVTGAGKTEMIFPAIAQALSRGERVAIASPRVDVCLELYPRLQAAFANTPIALLHGRQEERYQYRQLTICTTHQLLRFYHAFDNLIVDEVDSFPYAANEALLFATQQAVKENGGLLLMTATPGEVLLREVKWGRLQVAYLPLRYHGHLLPQITERLAIGWRRAVERHQLTRTIARQLTRWTIDHQRFLLFVPHVADLRPIASAVRHLCPQLKFKTVHAADPERLTKVMAMRQQEIQALITTTILERGVTFPGIDLGVIGADDPVFSTSALVQIAGRVGRSAQRPGGQVIFWVGSYCQNVIRAKRQIQQLNQRGRRVKNELSLM